MVLSKLLRTDAIRMKLGAINKRECIAELVDLLVQAKQISLSQRHDVLEAVMEREATASTGMEHGVALPHGATELVDRPVAALGIAPNGVPFQTIDGLPANLVFLFVLPKGEFKSQVHTWSCIAHLLTNAQLRKAVLWAKTPEEVLDIIEAEEKVKGLKSAL